MPRKMSRTEARELRIELLRARAAIERQNLRKYAGGVVEDLAPGNLVRGMLPAGFGQGGVGGLLAQGVGLLTRYPFLVSTVTGLLSGGSRRGARQRVLRVVVGALAGWQALRLARRKNRN